MNEILSAQCTVITIFSILFGLWYSEIQETIHQNIDFSRESDKHKIEKIRQVKNSKIRIVFLIIFFSLAIFLKPVIYIISDVILYFHTNAHLSLSDFEPIQASVFFVYILSLYLFKICLCWLIEANKIIKKGK